MARIWLTINYFVSRLFAALISRYARVARVAIIRSILVSHHHTVADLKELGQTIERTVLARAVKWHLEDRIIVHGNKTVAFA